MEYEFTCSYLKIGNRRPIALNIYVTKRYYLPDSIFAKTDSTADIPKYFYIVW